MSGSVFASVLAKYDCSWISSRSPDASFSSSYHGKAYGVQGEIGIRFGSDAFYAEPIMSGSYVRTDLDSPAVTNAALSFDSLDGVRGKAGLRIGTAFAAGSGNRAVIYLAANAVHTFSGRNTLGFMSNGMVFRYGSDRIGTYGEGKIGINIASTGGITGFFEGYGNTGAGNTALGARAGLRVKL